MNYCDGLFRKGAALLSMCMLDYVFQLVIKDKWRKSSSPCTCVHMHSTTEVVFINGLCIVSVRTVSFLKHAG